jgi:glycosyl-4,4'-diaponeurosporenoate acyltransferase
MELNPEKFAAVIIITQIAASVAVDHLSDETLESFRRRMRPIRWEANGEIYQQLFRIRAWKDFVPETGTQFRKNHMAGRDEGYLHRFILESVRAELCHAFALFLAVPLILNAETPVAEWAFFYCLFANVPFCMIQRYNRPRFERLLSEKSRRKMDGEIESTPYPSVLR